MKEITSLFEKNSKTYVLYALIAIAFILVAYNFTTFSFANAQETDPPTEEVIVETPINVQTLRTDDNCDQENQEDCVVQESEEDPKGSISGCKYFDATDNGELDITQPLSGWEFQLYQFPNAPWKQYPENQAIEAFETEKDGCYSFTDLDPGIYQVYEKVKPGWIQTHPAKTTDNGLTNPPQDGGNVLPLTLLPTPVPTGTDPASSLWNWINTKLFKNTTMFAILGNAWECLFSGNCNMAQRDELTNIRYYTAYLGTGESETMNIDGADFGNFRGEGTITGKKFNDKNKNGKQDGGEEGIEGWEIALYESPNAPWIADPIASSTPVAITTTDENGDYSFNVPSGLYQVFEVEQDGWQQTYPKLHATYLPTTLTPTEKAEVLLVNDVTAQKMLGCAVEFPTCSDELHQQLLAYRYYGVLLKPNQTINEVNFGNYVKSGEIHGFKFEDTNGNGVWDIDTDEEGLSGWEISLYQFPNAPWEDAPKNTPIATTTTGENGGYSFEGLVPGIYQVYETKVIDWTQKAPAGTQPAVLPVGMNVSDLIRAKLTENPTSQKLLGCVASATPCSDELHDELQNLRYFSVLVNPNEVIDAVDFGNQHKPILIADETATSTKPEVGDSLTATWHTNIFSTSRVVYGETSIPDPSLFSGPNYGYSFSTALQDTAPKVQDHSVTITGLTPGTTYYWRAISSASPEVLGGENTVTVPKEVTNQNNTQTNTQTNINGVAGNVLVVNSTQNNPVNTPHSNTSVASSQNENTTDQTPTIKRIAQVTEQNTPVVVNGETLDAPVSEIQTSGVTEEPTNILPPLSEDENSNSQLAGLMGLSGLPLWGVIALIAILLVVILRFAIRRKGL